MIASAPMEAHVTKILCVVGPTASGKTAMAVRLAKERNGEVISVDSRQVYRMLDIGSEKISPEEMEGIPHHLIDVRNPEEVYSASDFVADAERLITDIHARGKTPILAGGTHYYFDALLYGIPEGAENPALRKELENLSTEELFAKIETSDPRRAAEIDPHNRRRLIRALEIIARFGRVPERSRETPRYDVEWFVINPPFDELKKRISEREALKFPRGLIEEVHRVRERVGNARLNELGLEYRVVGEYLRGERDEASLLPTLLPKLFQYARRQKAWLRKLHL